MRWLRALAIAVLALAAGGCGGHASTRTLHGTTGPGFVIRLTEGGTRVTTLRPGSYTIQVVDRAADHSFSLVGPGVREETTTAEVGTFTWHVRLRKGTYTYLCAPHASIMRGSFVVA
jgi:hypothetical protein